MPPPPTVPPRYSRSTLAAAPPGRPPASPAVPPVTPPAQTVRPAASPKPKTCRCAAYRWPHRPGGGLCRWPAPPELVAPPPPKQRPNECRLRGSRLNIARWHGLHPIRDRDLIRLVLPVLYYRPDLSVVEALALARGGVQASCEGGSG